MTSFLDQPLPAGGSSSPDLLGDLDDRAQLRPLLAFGQNISLLGRGKAALRRETKLIERNVFRGLISSRLSGVPDLLVTSPSTTVLSFGTKRSGSKPPA